MRLDELVARQFGVSVKEAAALLMEGRVYRGEERLTTPGTRVPADTPLTLREKARKFASRSGLKLERALSAFEVDPAGQTACDIGASNGGFTDCLLQSGAAHVFAVDVAYGILAWELRQDSRVSVLERTNARRLTREQLAEAAGPDSPAGQRALEAGCDLVTCDVSFISLTKIFPAVDRVLGAQGACICLVKPQFEAPQRALGKNGIVKDRGILPPLLLSIADAAAQSGLFLQGLCVSPIRGTNGNVEFLSYFRREPGLSGEQRQALAVRVAAEEPGEAGEAGEPREPVARP